MRERDRERERERERESLGFGWVCVWGGGGEILGLPPSFASWLLSLHLSLASVDRRRRMMLLHFLDRRT